MFSTFFLLGNVKNSSTVDPQAIEGVVSLQSFGYFMGLVARKTQTANSGESTQIPVVAIIVTNSDNIPTPNNI